MINLAANVKPNLPRPADVLQFADDQCCVQSVGQPLTSGRFAGMHVVVCIWASTGREGTFIAETHKFTILDC